MSDFSRTYRVTRADLVRYASVAALSVVAGSWAAIGFWLGPMLATRWVYQLENLIEHTGLTHAQDTLENTRTIRTNALLRWIGWNIQYHTAHHTFPSVPFHRLPQLHALIVARTGREPHTMTYLEFQRQIISALRGGRSEADYPEDAAWILEASRSARAEAA